MLPLCCELDAGMPMHRLFTAFLNDRRPLFLDSSLPHPQLGRYSYIVADLFLLLRSKDGRTRVESRTEVFWLEGDPFDHSRCLMAPFRAESLPGLWPFQGGAAGYFGYDLGQYTERLPRTAVDDLGMPDMVIALYDWVLAHEHATARTWQRGSVTGCPKIRAMEIIDELEPTRRGIYCGSIGYPGYNGSFSSNIVICTAMIREGRIYFQVGGAVVDDSDPEAEYPETLDEARSLELALGGWSEIWETA